MPPASWSHLASEKARNRKGTKFPLMLGLFSLWVPFALGQPSRLKSSILCCVLFCFVGRCCHGAAVQKPFYFVQLVLGWWGLVWPFSWRAGGRGSEIVRVPQQGRLMDASHVRGRMFGKVCFQSKRRVLRSILFLNIWWSSVL